MKIKTYLMILLISISCSLAVISCGLVYLTFSGPLKAPQNIIIKPGKSTHFISSELFKADIIRYPTIFNIISKIYGLAGLHLKSGEYEILQGSTPFQVLQVLTSGQSIIHKFTVVEGSYVSDSIKRLKKEDLLLGDVENDIIEGYLMPSTYFYSYGDTKQKLLSQMKRAMSEVLDEYTPQLKPDSPIKNRLELLTLASIIEKEAFLKSEKPMIAAVFLNRLKIGMKLQADPTTIYGITLGQYHLSRPLSGTDLRSQTLYNTYYIKGLPPSPISCPSKSSIEAVVKPAKTKDLFFVVNGTGGHNFSSDLNTHNKHVENFRKSQAIQIFEKK